MERGKNRQVICYPQPAKRKALDICYAFAEGIIKCGGVARVETQTPKNLLEGDAFFYGVRPAWKHLWDQARNEKREIFYADNSYWDSTREKYFRVTKNALQCDGLQAVWTGEGVERFKALGLTIQDWRRDGEHVVVCPQSEEFLRVTAGFDGDWLAQACVAIRKHTDRPLRIRKKGERRPLADDLRGAWCLVTHMSCAAVEALLAGVPVFCTGRSAAQWMGSSDLSLVESPTYPERRLEFMQTLAENQWTVSEMRDGTCWRAFEEQRLRGIGHYGA